MRWRLRLEFGRFWKLTCTSSKAIETKQEPLREFCVN